MRPRIGAAALLLAIGIAACGSGTAVPVGNGSGAGTISIGSPQASGSATVISPQPTPTGSGSAPGPGSTVTSRPGTKTVLTESDSGKTYEIRLGDTVEVRLPSEYHPPASNGGSVLVRTSSSGGYPSGRPVDAYFKAESRGRADLSSTTDYACLHSTPRCGLPQRLWTVHVVVTSG